ncbi:DnaJ domain-containing protein, partial [Aspergillus keveii]
MGFDVKTDYYKILEVDQNANDKEIHKGFQNQAKKLHPDKNLGDSSYYTEKFQALSQAYDVLKDPDERSKYDKARRLEGSDKAVNTASSSSKMQPPFFTHPP